MNWIRESIHFWKKGMGMWINSLFLVNGELNFQFIFNSFWKKKVDFWMKKERWKLYLFIEDIAFKSNNFSKFLSVNLLIPWCISWDAFTRLANNTLRGDATNTTNANCLLAGLTYTYSLQPATSPKEMRQNYCKITSEKWIENELKMNWFIVKWMVNWIDSPFFKMNGELNWFTVFWKWMVNWMIHQKMVNGHRSASIARFISLDLYFSFKLRSTKELRKWGGGSKPFYCQSLHCFSVHKITSSSHALEML